MARMNALHPVPKVALPGGVWALLAPQAGRFAPGLRASLHLWNGTLQDSHPVILDDPQNRATVSHAFAATSGLSPAALKRAMLDLLVAVEGSLRQHTPRTPQSGPHGTYQATPGGLVWQKPTPNGVTPTR